MTMLPMNSIIKHQKRYLNAQATPHPKAATDNKTTPRPLPLHRPLKIITKLLNEVFGFFEEQAA